MQMENSLLFVQGFYYLITGIWPIFSMATFEKLTGHKKDRWLVKTIGLLLAVIGVTLITAGVKNNYASEIIILGIGSAGSLMSIDVIFSSKKIISPVYLLDAFVELIFIAVWLIILMS